MRPSPAPTATKPSSSPGRSCRISEHGHDEGLNVIGRIEKPVALDALLETVREVLEAETPQ
jgi:hypothetical protein